MSGNTNMPWILILVLGFTVTFHIQLYALFYTDREMTEDDIFCHSNVVISFSNESDLLPKTEEDLMREWKSVPRSNECVMSNGRQLKNYLSIGVAVHRFNPKFSRTVIDRTLESLVNKTSAYEKLHNVIIVIIPPRIASHDEDLLVEMIVRKFLYEINIGFLHLFRPPSTFNMTALVPASKCNLNSSYYRENSSLKIGSMWNVEPCFQLESMSSVLSYARSLSVNYLHLDDGTEAVVNFVEAIRAFVRNQKLVSKSWSILEFCKCDFLGFVIRSSDMMKFVHFFASFQASNQTTEDAFVLYQRLLSQKSRLLRTPEVFQRITGNSEKILDKEEEERRWEADDPPGIVLTNMKPVGNHIPEFVYGSHSGYFKAIMPEYGDWISIVFDNDVAIERIKIRTGQTSDFPARRESVLLEGILEASPKVLRMDASKNIVVCADLVKIGDVRNGMAEIASISRTVWGRKTRCLKLTVTRSDGRDVVFQQIAIYL